VKARYVVVLAIAMELFTASQIRDSHRPLRVFRLNNV
jgi:hypothetical protein